MIGVHFYSGLFVTIVLIFYTNGSYIQRLFEIRSDPLNLS